MLEKALEIQTKTIDWQGKDKIEVLETLKLTSSKINKFKPIAGAFPEDLLNNEAHREVEYIVKIEQKIKSIGSDSWKDKITVENAVESHKIPVDAINNFNSSTKPKKKTKSRKNQSQITG